MSTWKSQSTLEILNRLSNTRSNGRNDIWEIYERPDCRAIVLRLSRPVDYGRSRYHIEVMVDAYSLGRDVGCRIIEYTANNLLRQMDHELKEKYPMATADYADTLSYSNGTGDTTWATSTTAAGTLAVNTHGGFGFDPAYEPPMAKKDIDRIVEQKLKKLYESGDAPVVKKYNRSDPIDQLRKKVDTWLRPAMMQLRIA